MSTKSIRQWYSQHYVSGTTQCHIHKLQLCLMSICVHDVIKPYECHAWSCESYNHLTVFLLTGRGVWNQCLGVPSWFDRRRLHKVTHLQARQRIRSRAKACSWMDIKMRKHLITKRIILQYLRNAKYPASLFASHTITMYLSIIVIPPIIHITLQHHRSLLKFIYAVNFDY